MKKILYVGPFEIGKAETDSGILFPAKMLSEKFGDYSFRITVDESTPQEDIDLWKKRIPVLDFIKIPSPQKAPQGLKTLYHKILMWHSLKKFVAEFQPTHIYMRSCQYLGVAKRLACICDAKVILKLPGVNTPEMIMNMGRITLKTKLIERFIIAPAIRKADEITVVSWRFKSYLAETYFRSDAIVIPSTAVINPPVKIDRIAMRKKLGFESNDIVLCYSGGSSVWQRGKDMLDFFKKLNNIDYHIKLLLLSYNAEDFKKIMTKLNIAPEKIVITHVKREDIERYYAMADAGLCLRHNNLVNNVASPFKIGEYWAAGLPVIITRGIGEYSYEAIENKLGVVLADNFLDNQEEVYKTVKFLQTIDRADISQRCRTWAEKNISIDSQLDILQKLYQ